MRLMRTSVLEVAEFDYVRTARGKGAGETRLMVHHVARNALLPVVTLLGVQFSTILGGSVVIETVFTISGLGQLAYQAVTQRDTNMLMGLVFMSSIVVTVAPVVLRVTGLKKTFKPKHLARPPAQCGHRHRRCIA